MTYDQRCHDLALTFLEDEQLTPKERERNADGLAQAIQSCIEDWIEGIRVVIAEEHVL